MHGWLLKIPSRPSDPGACMRSNGADDLWLHLDPWMGRDTSEVLIGWLIGVFLFKMTCESYALPNFIGDRPSFAFGNGKSS